MARQQKIARSIVYAILGNNGAKARSLLARMLTAIAYFFALYQLSLTKHRNDLFEKLREQWQVDDEDYKDSFGQRNGLSANGDMGFSGSTFYTTGDGAYLVKSVPRGFEHSFFRDEFLEPYYNHMIEHTKSLLIRITDFLEWSRFGIGGLLGTAPTHHIIMENLLIGKEKDNTSKKWETWDLKPTSYFFPERDIANGKLTSDATKDRLADKFDDKIVLTQSQADDLFEQLSGDTELLQQCNAVDYSLFLVRIPLSSADDSSARQSQEAAIQQSKRPPFVPPTNSWRTGVYSADQKFVFRAAILDFFWAKHKLQPRVMTWLIKAWNLIDRQGHMSITTTPEEYRQRFLSMCHEMVEIKNSTH